MKMHPLVIFLTLLSVAFVPVHSIHCGEVGSIEVCMHQEDPARGVCSRV